MFYTLSLRPGDNKSIHLRESYTFLELMAQIGGLIFIINGILVYLMKPISHFALTMYSLQFFFFAKDGTKELFQFDEEERKKDFDLPRIFEQSKFNEFIKNNFKIKLNKKRYLKLLCLTQYCFDCWCFKR